MLIQAAQTRWNVPLNEITADRARVSHAASGQSASYGELVADAMKLQLPANVPLKSRDQFKLIGKTQKRIDTPSKVRGATVFGIDVRLPGMKVGTVRACPVQGGTLVSVDDTAARAIPGVLDVLKLGNAVAVVGEHYWAALKGLNALSIKWDYGKNAGFSTDQMMKDLENAFGRVAPVPAKSAGDVATAFANPAKKVEATYTLPLLAHASLEPINTTVHVRPDACEIWVGTQTPVGAQQIAASALKIDPSKVILNNHQIGGGFGRRLTAESIEQAVMFAKQVSYPVKLIWSREEDLQHDVYRPMYRDQVSAALDASGKLVGFQDRITGGSVLNFLVPGGFPQGALDSDAVSGAAETVYDLQTTLVDWTRVDPPITLGFWRGVGETHNSFVIESFMDEVAHAAGTDPVAFRLSLLGGNSRAAAVVKLAAEKSGWDQPLPARTGRGMSLHQAFSSPLALVVEVHVTEQGEIRLQKLTAAVDIGIAVNPDQIKAQIQGGTLFGLSAALYNGITFQDGRVQQNNFNDYRQLRIDEVPPFEVFILEGADHPGGIGESGTVSAAPALGNAIFAATGVRLRSLPFSSRELVAGGNVSVRTDQEG